ncbi:MAG: hypothetical protein DSM106950_04810 [Stigonema ocellatum SAG 48.90 = DSM 106950]|nr:hypothetical protein [Stigonema ocellatum SAG 48.90 = DSM 106950]
MAESVQPGLEVFQNVGKTLSDVTANTVGFTASSVAFALRVPKASPMLSKTFQEQQKN